MSKTALLEDGRAVFHYIKDVVDRVWTWEMIFHGHMIAGEVYGNRCLDIE